MALIFSKFNAPGLCKRNHRAASWLRPYTRVLYPNDDTERGQKILRLQAAVFLLYPLLVAGRCEDATRQSTDTISNSFTKCYAIQLNDTHPVSMLSPSSSEYLHDQRGSFTSKRHLEIAQKTFNYTNHTVMG